MSGGRTAVDRILDKVRDHGLHSLTRHEKKVLSRATERQHRAEPEVMGKVFFL